MTIGDLFIYEYNNLQKQIINSIKIINQIIEYKLINL